GLGGTAVYTLFFTDASTTQIYTLSLHDALPISADRSRRARDRRLRGARRAHRLARLRRAPGRRRHALRLDLRLVRRAVPRARALDRKSTRLNSSHSQISYAVFCLKKKKKEAHST